MRLTTSLVQQALSGAGIGSPPPGRLIVEAVYYWGDKRRHDTDNARKIVADVLAHGLGTDDCHFLWRDMDIALDRLNPRINLRIYPQ